MSRVPPERWLAKIKIGSSCGIVKDIVRFLPKERALINQDSDRGVEKNAANAGAVHLLPDTGKDLDNW